MQNQPTTFSEWQRYHYEFEKEYAKKVNASLKGSHERNQIFEDSYTKIIGDIIEQYNPSGGESSNNNQIMPIIYNLVLPGGNVLDLGCGSGSLVKTLLEAGYRAKGIDVSKNCIERARKNLSNAHQNCIEQADIFHFQSSQSFDCIVMDNVIEHFPADSIQDVLSKCYQLLNKGGCIIIFTPHKFSGPHDISKHFLPLGAKAEGSHLREFSFCDLEIDLQAVGFQNILGFPFHPRLLQKFNIFPQPSNWATHKAKYFETILSQRRLSGLVKINRSLTKIFVALLFPSICVALK